MSRIYTVSYQGTVTNAGGDSDLLEILPADDKPVKLRGMLLSQISEVGDTAEEGLRISIIRLPATVTGGSGGSAITPIPMDSADSAAGAATECNNTTVATTSGSAVTLAEIGWNNRMSPYEMWFPDSAFAPKAKQGEGLIVRMQTTPADDFTGCFTFWIEEE
jgi:hypothetical protein